MFDGLRKRLAAALKTLRGKGRLSEANIREAMEAIRIVLLDADVNFTAAENFINRITE
ncbi:MAG: signal recognition particle receptor subunit alpha, partial [Planctomycetota bacterium]|nr:signal recognition particle receptor subunit alpha [Planctomycetota bacterium]